MPLQQKALAQLSRLRGWLSRLPPQGIDGAETSPEADAAASLLWVEAALQADRQLWEALHRAFSRYLADTPPQNFLHELLEVLLRLTSSEYGFIGEVLHDPAGAPYLKTHAITNIAWDAASRAFYDAGVAGGLEFRNLKTLFGTVLTTRQLVLANDPGSDPRRGGLPSGHPPLRAFLGLPCCLGPEMIGMVGLANRPGGYELEVAEFLQPVLDTCGLLLSSFRQHQQRQRAEERQRQLEAERTEALQHLRLILDHMPIACIQNDAQGRFTYWNPAAEKLFGYQLEEVKGKHPFGLITPPASQPYVAEIFRRLEAGETLVEAEGVNNTRDGRPILCEWSNSPLRGADGAFLGIISMCRDITRQRHTEKARQRSEQLYRAVSEQMPDALFLLDLNDPACPGRIVEVNEAACRMQQSSRAELVGRSIFDLADPATADQRRERLERLQRGETLCYEAGLRRKDGTTLPVEVLARLITYGDRQLVLALDRDISERKKSEEVRRKLEAQLQHTQKLESLGVLAGGIAHDFNNLLTGILGNVSLAAMDVPPSSPLAYALQQIETAACRAADLTRQMLAYSGKGRFLIQPLNLSKVVEEMANLLHTVISKKAALRFEFTPNLPAIQADATQIRQVVMNLITNASDAIGDHSGTITLRTGVLHADRDYFTSAHVQEDLPEGQYAYVDVADTGCGMDAETRDRIFDPFFTTKHTGRGLGLAAVLGIMRGHHGAIKVDSELGRGTTFRLLFPCIDQMAEDSHHNLSVGELRRGSGGILVADDDAAVRVLVARLLEKAGFQVFQANDGQAAVDLYRQQAVRIRLVLLDWTMPHLSGEEAFREMCLINPQVRVVLMSGYNQQEVATHFESKNLAGFLQKPFRAADFLTIVQQAIDGGSLVRG